MKVWKQTVNRMFKISLTCPEISYVTTGYTEKHKKEIILLSKSGNIVSKYTSYVGVDKERPEKITGDMKKRDVPIAPKKVRLYKLIYSVYFTIVIIF